jgi:acetyl esterase/lipase
VACGRFALKPGGDVMQLVAGDSEGVDGIRHAGFHGRPLQPSRPAAVRGVGVRVHDAVTTAQVEEFHDALNAAGVANELVLLPATDHGFDGNWNALSTQIARECIPAFLAEFG